MFPKTVHRENRLYRLQRDLDVQRNEGCVPSRRSVGSTAGQRKQKVCNRVLRLSREVLADTVNRYNGDSLTHLFFTPELFIATGTEPRAASLLRLLHAEPLEQLSDIEFSAEEKTQIIRRSEIRVELFRQYLLLPDVGIEPDIKSGSGDLKQPFDVNSIEALTTVNRVLGSVDAATTAGDGRTSLVRLMVIAGLSAMTMAGLADVGAAALAGAPTAGAAGTDAAAAAAAGAAATVTRSTNSFLTSLPL
jgi:hypothetical protein